MSINKEHLQAFLNIFFFNAMVLISKTTFYIYVFNKMNISDGFLGGICNANTSSGCFDRNADCIDSICQCSKDFTDINGTCTAGKMLTLYNTIVEI